MMTVKRNEIKSSRRCEKKSFSISSESIKTYLHKVAPKLNELFVISFNSRHKTIKRIILGYTNIACNIPH